MPQETSWQSSSKPATIAPSKVKGSKLLRRRRAINASAADAFGTNVICDQWALAWLCHEQHKARFHGQDRTRAIKSVEKLQARPLYFYGKAGTPLARSMNAPGSGTYWVSSLRAPNGAAARSSIVAAMSGA